MKHSLVDDDYECKDTMLMFNYSNKRSGAGDCRSFFSNNTNKNTNSINDEAGQNRKEKDSTAPGITGYQSRPCGA